MKERERENNNKEAFPTLVFSLSGDLCLCFTHALPHLCFILFLVSLFFFSPQKYCSFRRLSGQEQQQHHRQTTKKQRMNFRFSCFLFSRDEIISIVYSCLVALISLLSILRNCLIRSLSHSSAAAFLSYSLNRILLCGFFVLVFLRECLCNLDTAKINF